MGINSSLTSLGKVIKELGDGVRHISYRDTVLTMLLKSSFGGRSATSVVINVAGDEEYVVYMCARVGVCGVYAVSSIDSCTPFVYIQSTTTRILIYDPRSAC